MDGLVTPVLAPMAVRLREQFPTCEVLFLGFSSCGVRLTIDHPDGVTAALTARIAAALRPLVPGHKLEVSSPGPRRPLRTPEHFERARGRRVRITTDVAEYGTLLAVDDLGIEFAGESGGRRRVRFGEITAARTAGR